MKKCEFIGLDQYYYKEELENGLTVYMVPYENKTNYSIHYVTRYGANDLAFVPYGKKEEVTVPAGIAHFLEHKMFEMENGEDPFSFASKSGTDCNAATYTNYTRFLFEGNKNFEENLEYLLTYVHSPYFTKENVEKEKGIIIQELAQYQDLVEYRLENMTKEAVFKEHPIRNDIGGTEESVNSITKEQLDTVYETFYQPSNMFLVITGKFDLEKALDIIKNNKALQKAKSNFPIQRKKYNESKEVCQKKIDIMFPTTTTTKMSYSLKINIKDQKDIFVTDLYFSLMLSMLFGISSDFRERMKKQELYTSFHYMKERADDYIYISFVAETEKPEELIEEIKKELQKMKLEEDVLERIKKVWISSEVMMIDNINVTLDNIVYDVIEYGDIIQDKIDIYKKLNLKDLKKLLQSTDLSNDAVVIIRPESN